MGEPSGGFFECVLGASSSRLLALPGFARSWGILVRPGASWAFLKRSVTSWVLPWVSWRVLGLPDASWVGLGFLGLPGLPEASWGILVLPGISRGFLSLPGHLRASGASWVLPGGSLVFSGASWVRPGCPLGFLRHPGTSLVRLVASLASRPHWALLPEVFVAYVCVDKDTTASARGAAEIAGRLLTLGRAVLFFLVAWLALDEAALLRIVCTLMG